MKDMFESYTTTIKRKFEENLILLIFFLCFCEIIFNISKPMKRKAILNWESINHVLFICIGGQSNSFFYYEFSRCCLYEIM